MPTTNALPSPTTNGHLPAGPLPRTREEVTAYVRERGVEFVFAQFVDMHGKPNAKLVPAHHLDGLFDDGAGFAGAAAGDIGQTPNDPDLEAMPDASSFTPLPWRPEIARMACDVHVLGEPWGYCPRTILRRQLARAAALGYEFKIGAELEYFLVRRRADGGIEPADALDTLEQPCYDMRALTRNLDFVGDVARHIDALGWDNYATDHEDANGQFEQNFGFADALTTCDRAIFFRYMVESIAQERGLIATFMPKPFAHLTGNGCHFHMSLWKDGVNVFEAPLDEDPNGLGLSPTAYRFLGGLKAHAKAYIGLTAPTVTSYKRLVVGSRSGSAWAPVHISYGANNRTQMLRIPGPGRIEDRTVDGSCNPYLAATALLAAGLDGIENELDPGAPTGSLNLHELSEQERVARGIDVLPANLLDATRELERDDVLRAALGSNAKGDYLDYFVGVKRAEWTRAQEQITQWELDRYLQLY
ncbi:type III glutamate--ammonia ligase [Conexibacter stalactiti]|uniref:Type III glutamate--ammonia ligase n=1 Tax=Conexibacter stalactiti TaxID=1940611 RepID=A0ABU4HMY8_9ACTN|nr:type III glutamate--ammonia ligase [Conexibacter stalactiti]MDW5594074.1 type III glutamate--ammonia ligase [Conexibacter stalactiti]MEC5034716.1 type III glutamate--ammonia ligase [Conexibacter stalactiti]